METDVDRENGFPSDDDLDVDLIKGDHSHHVDHDADDEAEPDGSESEVDGGMTSAVSLQLDAVSDDDSGPELGSVTEDTPRAGTRGKRLMASSTLSPSKRTKLRQAVLDEDPSPGTSTRI